MALAALIVLLFSRPAGAAPAGDPHALRTWARHEALPRLAARAIAGPEQADALRELGVALAQPAPTTGKPTGAPGRIAALTDHNPAFWAAAGASPRQTQFVLAMKIALLLADGRTADAADHYRLVTLTGVIDGPGSQVLTELAPTLGRVMHPGDLPDLLTQGDAALDRGDFGLAALAYRLAIIHLPIDLRQGRDLPGHYLYCLSKLGMEGPMICSRARFYHSVVFPTIEAQSRQRRLIQLAEADAPQATTTLSAVE